MERCTGWVARVAFALLALSPATSLSAAAPPPEGGTVAIEPQTGDGAPDPAMRSFVEAASQALTARGFTIFDDPAHAAYRAEITLSRARVGTGMGKDPNRESVGVAGSGVYVPMSTGNSSMLSLWRTQLEIRIRRREDQSVVWDGTAVTVRAAGARTKTGQSVASDLSQTLLANYPAIPEGVIGVP